MQNLSLRALYCLFLSGRLRQVLLYACKKEFIMILHFILSIFTFQRQFSENYYDEGDVEGVKPVFQDSGDEFGDG